MSHSNDFSTMDSPSKVILIGLDGLGRDEIADVAQDPADETFENLCNIGDLKELESTHPPWTPCAWPSMLSGRNPGKHGVFDFFTRSGYEKRLIQRSDVDSPYLYEVADSEGLTALIVNFPVTHPVTELEHGAVIPGYLAHEDVTFHPEYLREKYEERYGPYEIYPKYDVEADAVSEYVNVARHRRDMVRFLDEQYDWDLLGVQFQVTDSIFHDLDNGFKIHQVLKAVDGFVGDIIELGNDDTRIIVASDHGMGDYEWTFYINSWLEEFGYLQTTTGKTKYFGQTKDRLTGKNDESGLLQRMTKKTMIQLSKIGLSPKRIHRMLLIGGIADSVERLLPDDAFIAAQNQTVDHENSLAFQLYFNSLGVHLNVKGRDPDGTIHPEEYSKTRAELIQKLRRVRDPEGELVFKEACPREKVYTGNHMEGAPDIILKPRDYQYDISGSLVSTFRRNPHKNHKPNGILVTNCQIEKDQQVQIYDIAPTIGSILGIPIDENTDGEVLINQNDPVNRVDWDKLVSGYEQSQFDLDTSTVEDRLSGLGYLE